MHSLTFRYIQNAHNPRPLVLTPPDRHHVGKTKFPCNKKYISVIRGARRGSVTRPQSYHLCQPSVCPPRASCNRHRMSDATSSSVLPSDLDLLSAPLTQSKPEMTAEQVATAMLPRTVFFPAPPVPSFTVQQLLAHSIQRTYPPSLHCCAGVNSQID